MGNRREDKAKRENQEMRKGVPLWYVLDVCRVPSQGHCQVVQTEKHGGDSDAAPALQAAIDASSDDEKAEEKKEESEEEEEQHLQDPEPERCYCNDDDFEDMDCVQCDGCDIWFHLECLASYDNIELSIEDVAEGSWFCVKGACKEKGTQHKAEQQEKMQLKQAKAKDKREGKQRSKRGRKK